MNTRTDVFEGRRTGIGGEFDRWWQARRDEWKAGERHLVYTLIACSTMLLLGLIIVPLSIPEPIPGPTRAETLATTYLSAIPVSEANRPTLAEVKAMYGSDGGEACTAKLADAYGMLVTKVGSGPKTAFNKVALGRMQLAHSTYCPEHSAEFNEYVRQRTTASRRAREQALTGSRSM